MMFPFFDKHSRFRFRGTSCAGEVAGGGGASAGDRACPTIYIIIGQ